MTKDNEDFVYPDEIENALTQKCLGGQMSDYDMITYLKKIQKIEEN